MTELREETTESFVEGFALSGDMIVGEENKSFKITQLPVYENKEDLDNKGEDKRKLKCVVELSNGMIVDYYPNKTSIKTIMKKAGPMLSRWIGFKGEFFTERQKVGEKVKDVIYVKE